jgi:dihydrofolate reductase
MDEAYRGRREGRPAGRKVLMSRIVAFENVTLDGVMQAPAYPDEDTRGGFQHGGWATPYADEAAARAAASGMAETGGVLLGRVTYEDFASVWPNQPDNPFGAFLNATRKYVASTTLSEPLAWANSTLLEGDVVDTVSRLRAEPGQNLLVLGSGQLFRSLLRADLVDEITLQIHTQVLGSGLRLFDGDLTRSNFTLTNSTTTSTGVVINTYGLG